MRHRLFSDLPGEIGDALAVVNDTRVVPARIRLERPKGEVLLLERLHRGRRWSVAGARSADTAASAGEPARPARAARASRRGPLARSARRRTGRRGPAAAVHHRAARRSVALSDGLRRRARLRCRSDGRPALHAGASRTARRRARDAPRRPRHLPPADGGDARGARAARRALLRASTRVEADPGSRPRARGRDDDGAGARDGGKQQSVTRPDLALRDAGVRVSDGSMPC